MTCDLCAREIRGEPVRAAVGGQEKTFCSAGCARAYQDMHAQGADAQTVTAAQPLAPAFTGLMLNRGETARFAVQGMYCAGCAAAAERVLRRETGVKSAEVNFASEQGRIQYDPTQVDLAKVLRKLDRLGYQAHLLGDPQTERAEKQQEQMVLWLIVALAFGMQVMLLYLVQLYHLYAAGEFNSPEVRRLQYVVWVLATPVLFIGGWSFLLGAWRATLARTATMDTLVALGTLSAYSYSAYVTLTGRGETYFDSVAMITVFITLGRYVEKVGGRQARKDIRQLLKLQPENAWRRDGQSWNQVEAAALAIGDTILVKPGERAPVDAEVIEGEAAVNEALLTGESTPVNKMVGDVLFAGTVVTDDALVARVVRPVAEGRLARITQLVEETLNTKPPIQRMADRAAAYFAFGIIGVAVLTFLGWMLVGKPSSEALLIAVAVLVVACPCALGLATPLALAIALGRTSRIGILVRNPAALETAATVQRIAFDKTGTLTNGQLTVTQAVVAPEKAMTEAELLCLAAAVEQYSEHPVARAILNACSAPPRAAEGFNVARGLGARANVEGKAIKVGSARFLSLDGHSPWWADANDRAARGETIVWVGQDDTLVGYIALRDEPNPTAANGLRRLTDAHVRAVMLSGDSPQTTAAIAGELGLESYEGGVSPGEKVERIRAWQQAGERVGMVGDGVNDAPALAQADLSITAAGGTDVAGETSDVVLMSHDLTLVPEFIALSRRTRRIIRENLGWAFAYNLIAVPLAAFGVISPAIAAGAMAASSLLVVGNSLRLRR